MLHSKLSGKIMPGQWLKSWSQARHSWNSNSELELFTRCLSAIKSLLQSSRRDILGSSWPKRCFTSSTPCRVMRPRSLPLMSSVIEAGAFIKIWRCPLDPFSSQFCNGVWLWAFAKGQMRLQHHHCVIEKAITSGARCRCNFYMRFHTSLPPSCRTAVGRVNCKNWAKPFSRLGCKVCQIL